MRGLSTELEYVCWRLGRRWLWGKYDEGRWHGLILYNMVCDGDNVYHSDILHIERREGESVHNICNRKRERRDNRPR
jgi:hypothetical protein